jgi:membrane protease YdiL (CAAX protease family)
MERDDKEEGNRISLIQASAAFVLFCGISALSRVIAPLFFLMVLTGIAFPLIWAKRYHSWEEVGFRRGNMVRAVLWGIGAGLVTSIYTYFVFGKNQGLPDMVGLQLMVGVPVWFLVLSPFQEFFFRGWLQPRFERSVGKWSGLFITSACFTVWHFCPPFEGTSTSIIPITSFTGVASTFLFGVVFGYVFQRHNNILAPWIAHALAGIAAVSMGLMSFLQYSP